MGFELADLLTELHVFISIVEDNGVEFVYENGEVCPKADFAYERVTNALAAYQDAND